MKCLRLIHPVCLCALSGEAAIQDDGSRGYRQSSYRCMGSEVAMEFSVEKIEGFVSA